MQLDGRVSQQRLYKPNRLPAAIASGAIVTYTLSAIVFCVVEWTSQQLAPGWEQRAEAANPGLVLLLLGMLAGGLVTSVAWVVAASAYLVWLHRAAENARHRRPLQVGATPRMTVLSWFIPFMNLFRPYQIVRSVHHASRSRSAPGDWLRRFPWLLPLWWVTWIASWMLGNVSMRYSFSDDVALQETARRIDLATLPLLVIATGGALAVIWSIEARQRALAIQPAPDD
jgi:hypothetical protein